MNTSHVLEDMTKYSYMLVKVKVCCCLQGNNHRHKYIYMSVYAYIFMSMAITLSLTVDQSCFLSAVVPKRVLEGSEIKKKGQFMLTHSI